MIVAYAAVSSPESNFTVADYSVGIAVYDFGRGSWKYE